MEKNTIFDEEIIFFDAEIMDDDDDAPVGTLVVRPEAPATEATTDVTADQESFADETVAEAAPVVDETPAPAVNEVIAAPVAEEKVASQPAPKKAKTPKAEAPAEEKPVHAYIYGIQDYHSTKSTAYANSHHNATDNILSVGGNVVAFKGTYAWNNGIFEPPKNGGTFNYE